MTPVYSALFDLLGIFCHQMPERSWILLAVQFPLCIRCSALLLGGVLATGYLFTRTRTPSVWLAGLMTLPLLVDVAAQLVGPYEGNNWVRFATGLSFGFFSLVGSLKWLAEQAEKKTRKSSPLSPGSLARTA